MPQQSTSARVGLLQCRYTDTVPCAVTASSGYGLEKSHASSGLHLTIDSWRNVLGAKTEFPALCEFFDAQERELGLDELICCYAPVLIPGSAGALAHGIIHTGWALDEAAQSRWMLIEGLAYMAYTFVSVHPERFEHRAFDDASPLASLVRMAHQYKDENIGEWVERTKDASKYTVAHGFHPELHESGLDRQVAKVLEEGHHLFLCLPTWLDRVPLGSDHDLDDALEGVYKAFVTLYLVSAGQPDVDVTPETRDGDFVLLHLITSLWGAEHVIRALRDAGARQHALKCFWASMVAIAMTYDGVPSPQQLIGTWEKNTGEILDKQSWDDIVARACAEEEEHNIKLVHVCRKLWQRYDEWMGFKVAASTFTPTPDIGP